jgi:putative transposase
LRRVASMEWEREVWIREHQDGETIAEIARKHEISRKAVYKWIARYAEFGAEGLKDLSRAPERHPQAVSAIWQERIVAARREHPRWGAGKLAWLLCQRYQAEARPSASTIGRVLKQQGLSRSRRGVARAQSTGPLSSAEQPNEVWAIDFKGWRRTGDGQCCQPLTVTDQASRYLLCCQALPSTRTELVKPVLERVFRQYGLPQRMRSDNGPPFGSKGECGLTELSAWWIELGIECERIQPGHPQQNGRHERMHRTLGEETMDPPAPTMRQQQRRFEAFQREYNQQRPHEGLGQQVPAALYQPSGRPYPERSPQPDYGQHWRVRKVHEGGETSWKGQRFFISHALTGKHIGFEPLGDPLWRVWFHRHWLGIWDEKQNQFRRPRPFTRHS